MVSQGRVVEHGDHAALVALSGRYARLVEATLAKTASFRMT
jgi:ABC-type multidrug transport system fused ATPase/permease subunit